MMIIADRKIPEESLRNLGNYGEVIPFESSGVTYEAVSGHPDIFFCRVGNVLVYAPNTPPGIVKRLEEQGIMTATGESAVGMKYPGSAGYNAVCTPRYLLHNFRYTDSAITANAGELDLVHLNQGYARCNLLPLKNDRFITSDEGIRRTLTGHGIDCLHVDPQGILLPGFRHGFIGGAAGTFGDTVFWIGSLACHPDGKRIRDYLSVDGHTVIELYDGPLFDGGSLLFIE